MQFHFLIERYTIGSKIILGILFAVLFYMFLHYALKMIEMLYVMKYKKPLYFHFHPFIKKLTKQQQTLLKENFPFYNKLNQKQKKYFQHRVKSFISDKYFIGRNKLKINDEIRVLISATAVMLTFGFRDFYIGLISKIVVYPGEFYSRMNQKNHKGEFNPKLKTLALSWDDFKKGFDVYDDKVNLGIHEFAHAIHLNSLKERDVSSTIFSDSFKELVVLLSSDENLKSNLVASNYFRNYGYTNQYEFIAVIIEAFIESPIDFRNQFPLVYQKTKQMLNFNFAGY
ncbi:MAG TPA: zinc-dependent peptidase [Flavobacteriaceae bacterium]|nr:zinc-dependent peptidase [Flavobacteriaceae bacterium]